jgi:hypothetical protein
VPGITAITSSGPRAHPVGSDGRDRASCDAVDEMIDRLIDGERRAKLRAARATK